jgi:hypothetical protein
VKKLPVIRIGWPLIFGGLVAAASPIFAQTPVLSGAPTNVSYSSLVCSADGTMLAAADDGGNIYTSTNTGATWRTNIISPSFNAAIIYAASADLTKLMVGASNSTNAANQGYFISSDSGETWTQAVIDPFVVAITAAAASTDMTNLAATGLWHNPPAGAVAAVFTSTDAGMTWVTDTNVPGWGTRIASSADGTELAMVSIYAPQYLSYNAGVYTSQDSGATWALATASLAWSAPTWAVTSSADGIHLRALTLDTVYASDDSGATWSDVSWQLVLYSNVGSGVGLYTTLMAASADGTRLALAGPLTPIYSTGDSGANWQSNSPPINVTILVSSADGTKLAAATARKGIFTLQWPALTTVVTANPPSVQNGDEVDVVVSTRNNTTESLTNVQVDGSITIAGTGGVSAAGFSGPTVALTLAPGATTSFTNLYTATNDGTVNFTAATTGSDSSGVVISPAATSGNVNIAPEADLLVKTTATNDTTFVGGNEFQQVPSGDQNLTLPVGSNGMAGYIVRLQNDTPTAATFVLRGYTNSFPNWTVQVLAGSADIFGALTNVGGWTTPELDPGAYVDVQVSLAPMTNAGALDDKSLRIAAFADSANTNVLDAVILHATLVPVPIHVTLLAMTASGYTTDSIQAGLTNIDAPLVPATDPSLLASQPDIHGGLVADGVTPLVIQLAADPANIGQFTNGLEFALQPTILGAGTLNGNSISQRLQVLTNGAWLSATTVVLSASSPIAYVQIPPVLSDDLLFNGLTNGLGVDFSVVDSTSEVQSGDIQFALRKPPIALIHGYNTTGDWGSDFKTILSASRPYDPDGGLNNFICTVKYGQDTLPGFLTRHGLPVYVNTVAPLDACAQMALHSFITNMVPLHSAWAFTRFDVVAHSQGGVLTRMLCNVSSNAYISNAFRNSDNFYRGRFHRVVTLGSPHNGARLLRYLLDLDQSGKLVGFTALPLVVGLLGVNSEVAQAKFDPFGSQFAELNNPSPSAPWQPDPGASFHLVRTLIDNGASPGFYDLTPSYIALDLNTGAGGMDVIPRGSDGVVDFDSMGANVPPAAVGSNVFTLSSANDISHAGPTQLFFSTSVQTESTVEAQHVIGALDQDPSLPPADIIFGSFSVPSLLSTAQKDLIDGYAAFVTYKALARAAFSITKKLDSQSSYQCQLNFPTNLPPASDVAWFVQVYGPDGITSDGVELSPSGTNNSQVTITVDNALVGDVVLSAAYTSGSNTIVAIPPTLVVSLTPTGATLTGFQLLPGTIALSVGAVVSPQFLATYSDGSSSLRYVASNAVVVSSSQPAVVSVADPLNWQLSSIGSARITVAWSGFQAVSQITVFDPSTNTPPTLSILDSGNGQLTLEWPGFTTSYQLESNGDLSGTNSWQPVLTTPISAGGETSVTVAVTNTQQFYRLQWEP